MSCAAESETDDPRARRRRRKGEQADLFAELRAAFVRLRVDGKIYDIDSLPKLSKNVKHTTDVVVDRLKVRRS